MWVWGGGLLLQALLTLSLHLVSCHLSSQLSPLPVLVVTPVPSSLLLDFFPVPLSNLPSSPPEE